MFTSYHIIWLIICVVLISASLIILKKYKISLDRFLGFCCFGAVMAEIVKVFSVIKFVPLAGKETFTPYIEMTDVPLKAIGSILGGRDHSTVSYGIEKVADDVKTDEALCNTIDIIKKKINPI